MSEEPQEVQFTTIEQGEYKGDLGRCEGYDIRSAAQWKKHLPEFKMPKDLNFKKEMVLAIVFPRKKEEGWNASIDGAFEGDDGLYVPVSINSPEKRTGKNGTSPYHIVRLRRIDKEIEFEVFNS